MSQVDGQVDDRPAGNSENSGPGGPVASEAGSIVEQDRPVRLRLQVGYDGSGFCGWARQPGLRSVQAELESALGDVLRPGVPGPGVLGPGVLGPGVMKPGVMAGGVPNECRTALKVACAGRTDAGVHARGQVCHVDLPGLDVAGADWVRLRDRLHGRLPTDIRVGRVEPAPVGFDARWSALWRRYVYRVADPAGGFDPLLRGWVLWQRKELDVTAMAAAATPFVGEHDFAAFCKRRPGASTVRTVLGLEWSRTSSGLVEMSIQADAFCHSMVRGLVGAFLAVGLHRWPVDRPGELLGRAHRVPGASVAPAHGLCLEEVGYPDADLLGAQAARAKRWRGN